MNLFEIQKKRVEDNLRKSYEPAELIKVLEGDDLLKGKKANIGEIREWGGKKMQKTASGWELVKESQKNEKKVDAREKWDSMSPKERFKILGDGFSPSDRGTNYNGLSLGLRNKIKFHFEMEENGAPKSLNDVESLSAWRYLMIQKYGEVDPSKVTKEEYDKLIEVKKLEAQSKLDFLSKIKSGDS